MKNKLKFRTTKGFNGPVEFIAENYDSASYFYIRRPDGAIYFKMTVSQRKKLAKFLSEKK